MIQKIKSEVMFAVWNPCIGFYTDTGLTVAEMKDKHMTALGETRWSERAKAGDLVVKVKLVPQISKP